MSFDLSPALSLVILIATASAALAHALWGRHWFQLVMYWMFAAIGSLLVYSFGARLPLPLDLPNPAGVPVLEVVLAAWVVMFVASRLRL
jgi:hypothetical protein